MGCDSTVYLDLTVLDTMAVIAFQIPSPAPCHR